jgi:hypothetical protein
MDDRSSALLNLSAAKKTKVCEKFPTLGGLRAAIADGSIHQLDKGWGPEFVREVSNALAAYDKDHPLVSESTTEKEKDRQHLSAENEKNRNTQWGVAKVGFRGLIVAALIGAVALWWNHEPEKKDRSGLTETMLIKRPAAEEERKPRVGLTEPVLRKELEVPPDMLEQPEFLAQWKKAHDKGPTALAEFAKANQRGRVKNWKCKFLNVMTTSPTASIQGIKVAFDDDEVLIGTCFLPEGDKSARFRDVNPGTPLTLVKGVREIITPLAAEFKDCQFDR